MIEINKLLIALVMFLQAPMQAFGKFNYLNRKLPQNTKCRLLKALCAPRDVERWHNSHKKSKKTLSSHLLDSCWFTYLIVSVHNDMGEVPLDASKCALMASFHDYLEVFTGDILSTFKNSNPDAKRICLEEERKAFSDLIESVPEKLNKPLSDALGIFLKSDDELTNEEKTILQIVKYADLVSAYNECLEELGTGNIEFEEPSKYLMEKMESLAKLNKAIEYFHNQMFSCPSKPATINLA